MKQTECVGLSACGGPCDESCPVIRENQQVVSHVARSDVGMKQVESKQSRLILCRNCNEWQQAPNPEQGTCAVSETNNATNYDTRCLMGLSEKVEVHKHIYTLKNSRYETRIE
jgi:hypothetical protein